MEKSNCPRIEQLDSIQIDRIRTMTDSWSQLCIQIICISGSRTLSGYCTTLPALYMIDSIDSSTVDSSYHHAKSNRHDSIRVHELRNRIVLESNSSIRFDFDANRAIIESCTTLCR